MSDHPQPEPERAYETRDASISTIVFTACALVAVWMLVRRRPSPSVDDGPLDHAQQPQGQNLGD